MSWFSASSKLTKTTATVDLPERSTTCMSVEIDIQIASDVPGMPEEAEMTAWLEEAIGHRFSDEATELSVRVVDEEEGRQLNLRYRHIDKPTNVLSFPAEHDPVPEGMPRQLGDIVICAPVVTREAVEQGKDAQSHWAHMLVHGVLHLLGYDHETAGDAREMEAIERELLAKSGIEDPYNATY